MPSYQLSLHFQDSISERNNWRAVFSLSSFGGEGRGEEAVFMVLEFLTALTISERK